MFNKKSFLIVIFILTLLISTGCTKGSYTILKGDINFNEQSASGSYEKFNGYQEKIVNFSEGDTIIFNYEELTSAGNLVFSVLDNEDNVLLEFDNSVSDQKLQVDTSEKYKIRINGDDHSGSFALNWEFE